jgi:chromosome segregation ATPase
MEELRRELGETRFAKERLEVESRSVREISDKRKKALDDALAKLQEKKLQVEKQAEELNKRAEDIDAVNKKYEEIQATLSQKESALRGLNSAHEQLRTRFNEGQKKMEDEKWELASKLDDANSKCEEQERRMKQFVGEIENLKSAIARVQKKCSDAEGVAEEKTKAMQRLEAELESREATISVFSGNRTHSEVLKMKLAECERSLAQESARRVSVESTLEELRSKAGHLSKAEQAHNTVQEQLKWRKEQFGLLEEAHKKLQQQFQDRKDEWEGEKVGLITEISNLQTNLESQCRQSKDLELQLQRCNQALAYEESRRKVLEIQAEESRYGFEKVAAEFEEARSVIESLTEKSSKEVGLLRDSLASRERELREMEVKRIRMEQENQELKSTLDEFQAFKYGSEEMQGSLERFKIKYTAIEEAYKEISKQ